MFASWFVYGVVELLDGTPFLDVCSPDIQALSNDGEFLTPSPPSLDSPGTPVSSGKHGPLRHRRATGMPNVQNLAIFENRIHATK